MFIAVEGIDGAGKTTQVGFLVQRLRGACPVPVVVLHEPGGTLLGEAIGQLLKHDPHVAPTPEAELLMFLASRAQLVREVIQPALESGQIVVCDRFGASTLAYQGYGRGLDLELIRTMQDFATGGLIPSLTVLLDVPVGVGLKRKRSEVVREGGILQLSMFDRAAFDRFHDEATAFHQRVREGYLRLAAQATEQQGAGRWVVLDGTPPPEQVAEAVWAVVQPLLFEGNNPQQAPFT